VVKGGGGGKGGEMTQTLFVHMNKKNGLFNCPGKYRRMHEYSNPGEGIRQLMYEFFYYK
jgi:hypothetical protein